jgi:23S rRNA (cytidine1920-2'-O)/16S rRNA (cytidine1409-2'-O)-methyltransferase
LPGLSLTKLDYNYCMVKQRLDVLLTERGLAESRNQAQRLVMAGQVRVDGQVALKPDLRVASESVLAIDQGPPFVSRGGEKLAAALQAFGLTDLAGFTCVDVGASTGGFSDCLLQHGAARVYAIDVGHGLLHWKLRNDPHVIVMEKTNARFVEGFPEPIQLVTIDASFISLRILLPVVYQWFTRLPGQVVALIKPQFEAGRRQSARGEGVIRDPAIHRQVLLDVLTFAQNAGYGLAGLIRSPLLGPKGNVEFLAHLLADTPPDIDLQKTIDSVLDKLQSD